MPLLDAALAFAITMLAVATVVTKLVDFLQWALQRTPNILRAMFNKREDLFQVMIQDFLKNELDRIVMEENRLRGPTEQFPQLTYADLQALVGDIDHLSNADLVDKLKQTELGRQLLTKLADRGGAVFEEISRRYAAIERKYTEIFRQNARKVATAVALVVALVFNIDSVNILGSFIGNPMLSTAVATKAETTMSDYAARLKKLEEDKDKTAALQALQETKAEFQRDLDQLNSGIFPFGWSYFPYGQHPPKPWSRTAPEVQDKWSLKALRVWGGWSLGVIFTALLAGLGSPFWYDVINQITKTARGSSESPSGSTATSES